MSQFSTLIVKSDDEKVWKEKHEYVANCLLEGWELITSHAVTDSTGLVVYFFLVKR